MKKILCTAMVALSLAACKKHRHESPAITKEKLSGNYAFASATAKFGNTEKDITNNNTIIPACQKDDILTLKPDFTFSAPDIGISCALSNAHYGTWSLPNTSTLIIANETFVIKGFDGKNLKLGYSTDYLGASLEVTINFSKQQ